MKSTGEGRRPTPRQRRTLTRTASALGGLRFVVTSTLPGEDGRVREFVMAPLWRPAPQHTAPSDTLRP